MAVGMVLVLSVLLGLVSQAQGAVQLNQQFTDEGKVASIQTASILGVLSAGQVIVTVNYPTTVTRVGETAEIMIHAVGPALSGAFGNTASARLKLTGCTGTDIPLTTATSVGSDPGAVFTDNGVWTQGSFAAGQDLETYFALKVTVTATTCSGAGLAFACIAATAPANCGTVPPLWIMPFPVNIHTLETQSTVTNYNCAATGASFTALTDAQTCLIPFSGQQQWQCGASGTTVNSFSVSGTQCLNPQIDNENRLCGASTYGGACVNPTLNVANSGTTHLIIDSWPSLTAAVTNSGTINVVNSGGQTFTVSGSLAVTNSGTVNTVNSGSLAVTNSGTVNTVNSGSLAVTNSGSLAVSGGLTVTDDANGWSLNVASWPQLQAILSGEVHPCSTAARTADPLACHLDTTAANVNNTVGAVMVPSTFHLCGQEIVPGDCTPINSATTVADKLGTFVEHYWPVFLVFLVIIAGIFWANPMIVILGVMGIYVELAPGGPHGELGWFSLLILAGVLPNLVRTYRAFLAQRGA